MNKILIVLIVLAALGGVVLLVTAPDNARVDTTQETVGDEEVQTQPVQTTGTESAETTQTVVEVAESNGNFSTLLTAIDEAGLRETLSGAGPFTVFAPTDAAFESLPEGTLEAVLADQDQLTAILTYHVVDGKVMAADVVELDSATTLEGSDIAIEVTDEGVVLNDSINVVTTDIEASNGVIHVIDGVLLPSQ